MIEITVGPADFFFESRGLVTVPKTTLKLEHSLIAIHKWESKWHIPFLDPTIKKTNEQTIDYIKCMTINEKDVKTPLVYWAIPDKDIERIIAYNEDPHTATTFSKRGKNKGSREVLTAEVIYYLMFKNSIPKECEKWHINQLITLLNVFAAKDGPKEKMSTQDQLDEMSRLNAARRAKYNTKG